MRIEIEPSAEGVRYHHYQDISVEFDLYPLLYDRSSQCGQVVKKMSVLLKN